MLAFRLLGPLQVTRDGVPVELGGARRRAVLAMLTLDAGRVVPVARLVDGVWGERAPETAVTALHGHISQLRRALGDAAIITQAPGYRLDVPDDAIDARRLERDLAAGRVPELADAGSPLADLRDAPFAEPAVPVLEELLIAAHEARIDAELDRGRAGELVAELRARVAADQLRERSRGQLMLALHRAGRQAEALTV